MPFNSKGEECLETVGLIVAPWKLLQLCMETHVGVLPRVNNKGNRVLMSRNYRSDCCPRSLASRSNICFKNIKFPRGNFSR